jgi:hypothetical protein
MFGVQDFRRGSRGECVDNAIPGPDGESREFALGRRRCSRAYRDLLPGEASGTAPRYRRGHHRLHSRGNDAD